MPKRRKWLLISIVGLSLVCATWLLLPERQPSYQGKPLVYWLTLKSNDRRFVGFQADDAVVRDAARAREAVLNMGTNCLPFLLRWIAYEPPTWKTKLVKILRSVRWVPERLQVDRSQWRAQEAVTALQTLGTHASPAIPELTRLARDLNRRASSERAARALVTFGTEAQPIIMELINHKNPFIRRCAIIETAQFGTNALPAIPSIIERVKDSEIDVATVAARTLGDLQLRPDLCVPALTDALSDGRRGVEVEARVALEKLPGSFPSRR